VITLSLIVIQLGLLTTVPAEFVTVKVIVDVSVKAVHSVVTVLVTESVAAASPR